MFSTYARRYAVETIIALACLLVIAGGFLIRCHGLSRPGTAASSSMAAALIGSMERASTFPPMKRETVESSYSIDTIFQGISSQPVAGSRAAVATLTSDRPFVVVGWAVDSVARRTAAGVYLTIDGTREIPAVYGDPRPDVSSVLGYDATDCGFAALVYANEIPVGRHVLGLTIVDAGLDAQYVETSRVTLVITGRPR